MQLIVAWSLIELDASSDARINMDIGKGSTCYGGELIFFQALYICSNLKSVLPILSNRGSKAPIEENFWLTSQIVSSTDLA